MRLARRVKISRLGAVCNPKGRNPVKLLRLQAAFASEGGLRGSGDALDDAAMVRVVASGRVAVVVDTTVRRREVGVGAGADALLFSAAPRGKKKVATTRGGARDDGGTRLVIILW